MNWTEEKEQQFQALLHERQNATRQTLAAYGDDIIEPLSNNLYEDTDAQSVWQSFVDYESPFVVADMFADCSGELHQVKNNQK